MRMWLGAAVASSAMLAAGAAGAVTPVSVANAVATMGTLIVQDLAANTDLRNNGPLASATKAYLFNEGVNQNGDLSYLLHFDRTGILVSEVKGSFDFLLQPGELFADVFSTAGDLINSDNTLNGVKYQRDTSNIFAAAVTVFRGLENPNIPFIGDVLTITPNQTVTNNAPSYHVVYDFKNDGVSLDEVRFVFSAAPSAAPEPSSWALAIGGLGMVGAALRARRRTAAAAA